MKVVLATGVPRTNDKIEKRLFEEIEVVGKPLYREAVDSVLERTKAEVLIISHKLEGVTEMEELILQIRARHKKTRIIFIGKDLPYEFKSFLYKYVVYDVVNEPFSETDLRNALFFPKSWEDIAEEIDSLGGFDKPADVNTNKVNPEDLAKIDKAEYARIKPSVTNNNDSLYQEFITFWSVLDQSGKSFSAVNTSLFLASNPSLKILLLDFNIKNPSIHLYFGLADGDRNLGALVEDLDDGIELNEQIFDEYLITHPVYKNLKILPGYILRNKEKGSKEFIDIFENILRIAQASNFSTILVDMEAGMRDELSIHLLKISTKILMHVNEGPGNLFATRKMFDSELGPFVPNLISKKKVFPILNRATEEYKGKFKNFLDNVLDGNRTVTVFKDDKEIHASIFEGSPLLKKPTEQYYITFLKIANVIHPGIFKSVVKKQPPTQPDTKQKKSFFAKKDKKK